MTTYVMSDAKVWVAQYDVSGDLNALALANAAEVKDATTFGAGARIHRGGIKSVDLQLEGFYQAGTDLIDEIVFSRIGTPNLPVSCSPTGGAEGQTAYLFLAELARYRLGGEMGEMLPFTVEAEAQGQPLVKGQVLLNGIKGTTGNGTAVQLGAVGAGQKLYAALHVLAASGGTPSVTVKVQSDDNSGFTTPTDRITFGAKTSASYEWATPVGGAITDDYWRFTWTISGSTPSFTLVGVLGIL
jgi:hypothetical protein